VLLDDTVYDTTDLAAANGHSLLVVYPRGAQAVSPLRNVAPASGPDYDLRPSAARRAPPPDRSPSSTRRAGPLDAIILPPPPLRRPRVETMRFGAAMLTNELDPNEPRIITPGASGGGEVCPPGANALSLRALRLGITRTGAYEARRSAIEEPEVELVGVAPEAEDHAPATADSAPALAALRVLRHRLEKRRSEGDGKLVVSLVSPAQGEGKTTIAVRLALILCESDRARVALVDANLGRPGVARALGLELPDSAGLSHQIHRHRSGNVRSWGVVKLAPSLAVLAEGEANAGFSAALHSAHFEEAIAALRRAYDYVVIDGPQVLGAGDATVVEDVSDSVIVVARSARTTASALRRATSEIGERRILGVVLNDVATRRAKGRFA
jgi:Mrp family chromosome partitioning ATPase